MKLSLNLDYDGNIYKVEWPWVGSNSDGIYFIQNLKFDMFLCHFFSVYCRARHFPGGWEEWEQRASRKG